MPTPTPLCPHLDKKLLPVCWDCAEEGQVHDNRTTSGNVPPTWQKFKKIQSNFGIRSGNFRAGMQSTAPEVHPPEEGLEVGRPAFRESQPGLMVVGVPGATRSKEEPLISKPEQDNGHRGWGSRKTGVGSPAKVLGLRRKTFLTIGTIMMLFAAALILGIVVSTMQKRNNTQSTSPDMPSSEAPSSLSPSSHAETAATKVPATITLAVTVDRSEGDKATAAVSTVFIVSTAEAPAEPVASQPTVSSSTTSIAPAATGVSSRVCIGADGSTYTDPATGTEFRLECAAAHHGKDIENVEAASMQSCISMCANNDQCKGAIWYNVGLQGTNLNYCWLKSKMENDVKMTRDAQSVVRL
ncbi:hypothetical protein SAMD00023353_6300660 [Rosellinia necatrix]|uniref:Uncharacterized protein n=1 Tax=Rosellinia necatrix TaxID=77044 RepID=A0A1W2TSD6_ROSNE|nr:hypothetical protein SAMD00023353_6300660 [Rosellinia necatrix]